MAADLQVYLSNHLQIRRNILRLIDGLSWEQLTLVPPHLNNNVLWNAGHIVAVHELLTYALGGHRMPSEKAFIGRYRPGSRPGPESEQADLDYIRAELLAATPRIQNDYRELDWSDFQPYTTKLGVEVRDIEQAINFNTLHEALHFGTMQAIRSWVLNAGTT